jgi:hypothetical protein
MDDESLYEDLPPPVEELSLLSDHSSNFENIIFEDLIINQDILESESDVNVNYPNEAYEDFMTLVIKNKLSNKTGNEIIHFFNKYANLVISPLPKSTE